LVTNQEIASVSKKLGITLVGITSTDRLKDLPTGSVLDVVNLQGVIEVLPSTRSVLIAAYRTWDPIFNVVASGPKWLREGVPLDDEGSEFYQLYSQVLDAKAWALTHYLQMNGFEAVVSRRISLKPAAVIAGLGFRGKNTLVINPEHGPYVRFTAVLTSARLDPDEPSMKGGCGECTRCIDACPTGALKPYEIDIRRCLTYAAENHASPLVEEDVRDLEKKLIKRPTLNSFIECTICQDVCQAHLHTHEETQ
jgi:epoxyqueuosine reductase